MRKISLLFLVTLTITALVGCDFGVGSAGAGNENPYVALEESDGAVSSLGAFTVGAAATDEITANGGGTFTSGTTDQVLYIEFSGVDIDESTVASGIVLYSLANNASGNAYALAAQTALTPASTVVVTEGPGSFVVMNFDLTNVTTTPVALFIDASVVTANGGTVKFDVDGDNIAGEDDDDQWFDIPTGGTAVVGVTQDPAATVGVTLDYDISDGTYDAVGWTSGTANIEELTAIPSSTVPMGMLFSDPQGNATATEYDGTVTPASLGNTTLQGYSDGTWTEIGLTATADSGQDSGIKLVPAATLVDGGLYRIKFDNYGAEASAWNSYVHRFGTYDANAGGRYDYYYFNIDTGTVFEATNNNDFSVSSAVSADELSASIDLDFDDTGVGSINRVGSLSADQVSVSVENSGGTDFFEVDVSRVVRLSDTLFRVILAPVNESLVNRDYKVLLPKYELTDDQNTDVTTDDRRLNLNTGTTVDGVFEELSGTF